MVTAAPTPLRSRHTSHRRLVLEIAAFAVLVITVVTLAIALHNRSSSGTGAQGSGVAASQVRSVPPFTTVELAGGVNVTVTAGARQGVVVHADSNILDHITTSVVRGRLVVADKGSFTTKAPTNVAVTVTELEGLALTGGGILNAKDIHASALALTLSGGGLMQVSGTVRNLTVLLTGGGAAQLGGLVAQNARVRLTGAGLVTVDATDTLDAALTGAGSILYSGNPRHLTTNLSGSGAIIPR
jgi:hypothetical protein